MKKNKMLLSCIIWMAITLSYSCSKKCGDDTRDSPLSYLDANIGITYYDHASDDFLIKEQRGAYSPTDVIAYDENLQKIPFDVVLKLNNNSIRGYSVSIPLFREWKVGFNYREIYSRRIFVNLKMDRDTIDYKFKIKPLACGSQLEYLDVRYNDIEVASLKNGWNTEFSIRK